MSYAYMVPNTSSEPSHFWAQNLNVTTTIKNKRIIYIFNRKNFSDCKKKKKLPAANNAIGRYTFQAAHANGSQVLRLSVVLNLFGVKKKSLDCLYL